MFDCIYKERYNGGHTMLIGVQTTGIQTDATIIEPNINREASTYLLTDYKNILNNLIKSNSKRAHRIDINKAEDLLHDVYISLVEAEENGEGFDMEYGSRVNENGEVEPNLISVEQFVNGRIKLYAKNSKYSSSVVESKSDTVNERHVILSTEIDRDGNDVIAKNGKKKLVKKVRNKKVGITVSTVAASFNDGGDVVDNNDDFQRAYAMSAVADTTDDIAEQLSLRSQIDYCIDICSLHGVNILNILKNIDTIDRLLGDNGAKLKHGESVFSKLAELANYHTELGDTLMDILRYSSRNRAAFDAVISTY